MSEMDKEAEREKLRQQLEKEEEDRKATQHMSELLLKGATMTNKHCDECGDPIFRQGGREFCPTCGKVPGQAAAGKAEQETEPDAQPGSEADSGVSVKAASQPTAPAGEGDLDEARASLTRTLTTLAQRAEATDDLHHARELLAAAKEAAEALQAVEAAR